MNSSQISNLSLIWLVIAGIINNVLMFTYFLTNHDLQFQLWGFLIDAVILVFILAEDKG